MLAVIAVLTGVLALLVVSEMLGRRKNLRGDLQRQFVHISVGSFIAFWPWLISWLAIEWIGVAMLALTLLNYRVKIIDFHSKLNRESNGHVFYALAVISSALLTHQKVFFALAMLIMAIGDGAANLIGQKYGKHWHYKFFHHTRTVIGSMSLWFISLCILGVGLLLAHNYVNYSAYAVLLLALPPIIVLAEGTSPIGLDNLVVPVVVLLVLNLTQ